MYPEEVIRYIIGNYTGTDKQVLEKLLANNSTTREELDSLQSLWETSENLQLVKNENEAWKHLSAKIEDVPNSQKKIKIGRFPQKNVKSKLVGFIVRAAAAFLIAAGTYAFYQINYSEIQPQSAVPQLVYHTLVSDVGEQIHFRFNDGSKVVLNGKSNIRYRSDFGSGTRELHLTGEAYFEVNHDHALPFVVHAEHMRVTDIGTKFNINAYPEGDFYEVTVSEGEVEVLAAERSREDSTLHSQPVRITQGQKVEVGRQAGEMVISKANLHANLGWLNKRLIFDEEPLNQIISRLERYYDINIKVKDEELLAKEVTASFENEGMENVFKVLSLSLKANYNINKNNVELQKNTQVTDNNINN